MCCGGRGFWRAKVIVGHAEKSGEAYATRDIRYLAIWATVMMTINPVEGQKQTLFDITGGIFEDTVFSPDGISRGLCIPEATINIIDNPIFGNATYDTEWAHGAGIIHAKNTDKEFIGWGNASVKLTQITAANNTWYQSVAAGETTTYTHTAYVKKADGSAVTASDVKIWYADAKASTYTAKGRASTPCPGRARQLQRRRKRESHYRRLARLYIYWLPDGGEDLRHPLMHGDMMGCSWSGTAHGDASTSTRVRGKCVNYTYTGLLRIMDIRRGTVRVIWTPDKANTALTADIYIWSILNGLIASFDNDDEKFYFTDSTNTISSAARPSPPIPRLYCIMCIRKAA